jgi:ubiquinone/menaquinone biosynthesis C-methylase UbiE
VALDVSLDMIERARQVAPGNVAFEQVEGTLIPLADREADAVFSVHVMQHLETVEMLRAYIAEMRRVLRSGGTLMVHILLRGASESGPRARLEQIRGEWALWRSRRALRRGGEHSTMRTRSYWPNDVWQMLTDAGFHDVELRMIPVRSNGYGHQFWFARAS